MDKPTYEVLEAKLQKTEYRLRLYQDAVNKIDDYYEYRFESAKDQDHVFEILDTLNKYLLQAKP